MQYITDLNTLEDLILSEILSNQDRNRVIVTGVSNTGKSTFLRMIEDKYSREFYNIKSIRYPHFFLNQEDEYLLLKYHRIIDRWYPFDSYVFNNTNLMKLSNYNRNVTVVIFLNKRFDSLSKDDNRNKEDINIQYRKYEDLANELDKTGLFNVVVYK